jgi:hypothetical protein
MAITVLSANYCAASLAEENPKPPPDHVKLNTHDWFNDDQLRGTMEPVTQDSFGPKCALG